MQPRITIFTRHDLQPRFYHLAASDLRFDHLKPELQKQWAEGKAVLETRDGQRVTLKETPPEPAPAP